MNNKIRDSFDPVNAVVALGIWLLTLTVYALTRAATLSFWDCGEFIAASHILGVPHPPGTPLYVMIGRVFTLLPIASDLAARVNLLSSLCSSFTAVFGYLAAVRILRLWFGSVESVYARLLVYGGAASGALFLAFGLTNWTNSVEAEVYGMAMMFLTAILWLALIYLECKGTAWGEKLLLLMVFLVFLGIGIHMTIFMIFPVVGLFFLVKKEAGRCVWYSVASFFAVELYLIFALSSKPGEIPFYLPVGLVFLLYLFYIFSFEKVPRLFVWGAAFYLVALTPFYVYAITAARNGGAGEAAPAELFNVIGAGGVVALIGLALYCLQRYYQTRVKSKDSERDAYRAVITFVAATVALILALYVPKGFISFLFITALILGALAVWHWRWINWPMFVAVAGVSMIIIGLQWFMFGMIIGLVLILVLGLALKQPGWKTALMVLVVAVVGFSVHVYVPIRSAQQPTINENNPSKNLTATINYLERKQYGSQNMVERMFVRRAEWGNQLGNYRRMGFWRFFQDQYGLTGPKFIPLFLLGIFGIWETVRRRHKIGLVFLVLLLISTVGLVLYMNFADGTRQSLHTGADHIEVRDRDYFFTPGFILFGLAIGIGSAIVLNYIREAVRHLSTVPRRTVMVSSLVLLLLPSFALGANYYHCDRSNNYIPYDYAWNLLTTADEGAVLFTNGDNDTFPLWCLQEVYGIRTDVKVVNLALSGTKWYIKQIQSTMGLDLGWSESHIDQMEPFRIPDSTELARRGQYVNEVVYGYLGVSQEEKKQLYETFGVPYGAAFRLSNQVMDKIIYRYAGKRPINYSVTVGGSTRRYLGRSIDSLLSLNGMMWRLNESGSAIRADVDATYDFFMNPERFRARGVNDPAVYKNETTLRLTNNYANGFLLVADTLRVMGDLERTEQLVSRAVELIPHSEDAVSFLVTLYSQLGETDKLRNVLASTDIGDRRWFTVLLALGYRIGNHEDSARIILDNLSRENPEYRPAFEELARLYYETNEVQSMTDLLQRWLQYNPTDQRTREMLADLRKNISRLRDTAGTDSQ